MATASATSATLHSIGGMMPHGLGLLTTVASLPPKYRSRYLNVKTKCEIPLDLSVKPMSPQIANDVPMASTFTEVYTEPSVEQANAGTDAADILIASIATAVAQEHEQQQQQQQQQQQEATKLLLNKAITPPPQITTTTAATVNAAAMPTPLKRKWVERERAERERETAARKQMKLTTQGADEELGTVAPAATATATTSSSSSTSTTSTSAMAALALKKECTTTPNKPIRVSDSAPRTVKSQATQSGKSNKNKATRKLKFDEETSSPVSGTIIRPLEDITDGTMQYSNGDIDPRYNIVEITEETKAELAAIKNVIGDYICKLCRIKFDDAFGLAQHRCACIVLLEYRCPECGKQFNCPANLASHRRWHKPKKGDATGSGGSGGGGGAVSKKENRQQNGNAVSGTQSQAGGGNRKVEELEHTCDHCGKQFKRLAYLRKHLLTHNNNNNNNNNNSKKSKNTSTLPATTNKTAESTEMMMLMTTATTNDNQSYASSSFSAASSVHSFATASHDDGEPESTYTMHVTATNQQHHHGGGGGGGEYDDDIDSLSDCSSNSSSAGYGRLQIVESGLTEEENIAAAALTNLRNCASVIQHTTMAH